MTSFARIPESAGMHEQATQLPRVLHRHLPLDTRDAALPVCHVRPQAADAGAVSAGIICYSLHEVLESISGEVARSKSEVELHYERDSYRH